MSVTYDHILMRGIHCIQHRHLHGREEESHIQTTGYQLNNCPEGAIIMQESAKTIQILPFLTTLKSQRGRGTSLSC